jgi:2-keto-4-pentenoate hydratase/2-oxohepta-3-ene-1,7-dioic acid hydratase in catechol pathway
MSSERPRLAGFIAGGKRRYGLVRDDGVVDLSCDMGARWPTLREAIADNGLSLLVETGLRRSVDFAAHEFGYDLPVPAPEKLICVGVNYPDRNEEYKDGAPAQQNPSLFVRFPRSFVGHGAPLVRPKESIQLDYEGELVVVIGKAGRRIREQDALSHIAALSLCNEGTIRDWVRHAKFNVTQGKNFDASGSFGPWLIPFEDEAQLADVALTTRVNGEVRQHDRTSRMLFSVRKLIAYISIFTTLVPGDVIATGTPTGAGARRDPPVWLNPGDVIEVEGEGIGVLRNGVIAEG